MYECHAQRLSDLTEQWMARQFFRHYLARCTSEQRTRFAPALRDTQCVVVRRTDGVAPDPCQVVDVEATVLTRDDRHRLLVVLVVLIDECDEALCTAYLVGCTHTRSRAVLFARHHTAGHKPSADAPALAQDYKYIALCDLENTADGVVRLLDELVGQSVPVEAEQRVASPPVACPAPIAKRRHTAPEPSVRVIRAQPPRTGRVCMQRVSARMDARLSVLYNIHDSGTCTSAAAMRALAVLPEQCAEEDVAHWIICTAAAMSRCTADRYEELEVALATLSFEQLPTHTKVQRFAESDFVWDADACAKHYAMDASRMFADMMRHRLRVCIMHARERLGYADWDGGPTRLEAGQISMHNDVYERVVSVRQLFVDMCDK